MGLAILVITPPFEVPDEPQHFFRAFQFSEGRREAVVLDTEDKFAGISSTQTATMLPKSLSALVDASDLANVRFKPDNKIDLSKIRASVTTPLNPSEREYLPIPTYPPAAYVPQVVGIWIGRLLGLSPLFLFYSARLCALCAWLALTFFAIRATPILKWAYFLLALMPMTLFMVGSNSSDSIILGVSFLMSATLFRWAYDSTKGRITMADLGALLAMAVVIALSKAIYLSLLFLYFLVPQKKFASRKIHYLALAAIIAVSIGAYFGWTVLDVPVTLHGPTVQLARYGVDRAPVPNVSPIKQLEFIRLHTVEFAAVLANTFAVFGLYYLYSFVGFFGWLDTPLPGALVFMYAVALTGACFISSDIVNWKQRTLGFSVFAVTTLVSLVYFYLGWNSVGMDRIGGFQGRYLIPLAPALLLVFSRTSRSEIRNLFSMLLIAFVLLSNSIAAYALVDRFYIPSRAAYHLDELTLSTDGTSVVIKGWAIDRATAEQPTQVEVVIDGHYYPAEYGKERPDASEALGKPSFRYSGFEANISSMQLERGPHRVGLRIRMHDGRSYTLRGQLLTFDPH